MGIITTPVAKACNVIVFWQQQYCNTIVCQKCVISGHIAAYGLNQYNDLTSDSEQLESRSSRLVKTRYSYCTKGRG